MIDDPHNEDVHPGVERSLDRNRTGFFFIRRDIDREVIDHSHRDSSFRPVVETTLARIPRDGVSRLR